MLNDAERAEAHADTIVVRGYWESGERASAIQMARETVDRWPGYFESLEQFTQEQLVWRIDAARGDRDWSDGEKHISLAEELRVQAFLHARYEPQTIAGIGNMFGSMRMIQDALAREIPD